MLIYCGPGTICVYMYLGNFLQHFSVSCLCCTYNRTQNIQAGRLLILATSRLEFGLNTPGFFQTSKCWEYPPLHQMHKNETSTEDVYICLSCPGAVSSVEICKQQVKKKRKKNFYECAMDSYKDHIPQTCCKHLHTVQLMGVPLCFCKRVLSCKRITM